MGRRDRGGCRLPPGRPQRIQPAAVRRDHRHPGRGVAQTDGHRDRASRPTPAAVSKVGVQPGRVQPGDERERGDDLARPARAARSAGSPAAPAAAGNQAGISRSTLMNVIASPAPTSTRAASPSRQAAGRRHQQLAAGHERRRRRRSCGVSRPGRAARRPAPASPRTPRAGRRRAGTSTAGADAEALLRVEAGDAERGPVEDRHRVREDAESPHHPGPPRNRPHDSLVTRCVLPGHPRPAPHAPSPAYVDRAVATRSPVRTPDQAARRRGRRRTGQSQPRRTASTPAWNRLDAPSRSRMSATCRR